MPATAALPWPASATPSEPTHTVTDTNNQQPWLDRFYARWMPERAARRAEARVQLQAWQTTERLLPRMEFSYSGGLTTRLGTNYPASQGMIGTNSPLKRATLRAMRDRSRHLDRNNPLAASLLDRSVENVIGHGMKLQAMTDDDGFNEAVETLWEDWWCGGKADIRGMSTGAQLESLWYRTHLCDGDLGIGLVDQGDNGAFVQTITGEYIDTLTGGYDAKTRTFEGIQFNQFGRPVAFNVLTEDPATLARSSKPVDARDFIFYPRLKHTNQLRGEPAFATTFDLFDQTYGIIDASTIAVRIAACQAMIVKKGAAGTALTNLPTVTNSQGAAQKALTIEPGMVHYLQPGEDIASFNPSQPQQNLPEFLRLLFRTVGIAVGLPLEILMLDFSQSNYSNARAALLQLQRACRPQQRLFCKRVMSRIYQWRVSKWVKDGELKVPAAITDTYWTHNFLPPGWAWVDPQKDGAANMMKLDAGLTTKAQICAEQGEEYDDIRAVRSKEIKDDEEAGLPEVRSHLTRDPMAPPDPNATNPQDTTDDEPDPDSNNVD
jgi:lambda family phage portal protein